MAYVAVSRGARDAQIFTSNREKPPEALSREVSQQSAHTPELETKQAVEVRVAPQAMFHAAAEHERHHAPIREALEPEDAAQCRHRPELPHTETGGHIRIDGKGTF